MAGQYPCAAIVGTAIDRYGAWSCSFAAAILYSLGFGLFARDVAQAPPDAVFASDGLFHRLVLYFVMIGLATACSCVHPSCNEFLIELIFNATGTSRSSSLRRNPSRSILESPPGRVCPFLDSRRCSCPLWHPRSSQSRAKLSTSPGTSHGWLWWPARST